MTATGPSLLVQLRTQRRLTQAQLAERAGASRSMIAQLEMGERQPSRKLLIRLCGALDLSAENEDQLYVAYGFTPSPGTLEQLTAHLRANKSLPPEQAERLTRLFQLAYERSLEERLPESRGNGNGRTPGEDD